MSDYLPQAIKEPFVNRIMGPAEMHQKTRSDESEFDTGLAECLGFFQHFEFGHPESIERILKFALDLLHVECVAFSKFDFEREEVGILKGYRCPAGFRRATPFNETICFDMFVIEARAIAIVEDLRNSKYWEADSEIRSYDLRAYLGFPVKIDGRLIGSLAAFDSKPRRFGDFQIGALGMLAILMTFVEQHHAVQSSIEDRLSASESLNDQMLQLVPVAIYKIDLIQQRFIMVNQQMCLATGYSEEELLAMKPLDLLTSRSQAIFMQRCQAMSAGQRVSSNVELEVVTKSGENQWAHIHALHLSEKGRIAGANVVAHFITEQKKVREELAEYRKKLETLVQARTAELARINSQLREEIVRRADATEKLRVSSDHLKEMNTAMRVLLDKRIEDQQRAEEIIRMNLKELIDPYLERLANSGLNNSQKQLLDVIRMNLEEVVGSTIPEFSNKYYMLSPNEIQVVNLIRKGKTTKEMSKLLNLSVRTIEAYRNSIRRKLKLKNKKVNLKTYLASI